MFRKGDLSASNSMRAECPAGATRKSPSPTEPPKNDAKGAGGQFWQASLAHE